MTQPDDSKARLEEYLDGVRSTTSGRFPETFDGPAPAPVNAATGQHRDYWVLSATERAKGFVRPVRRSYVHVGMPGPKYPLRDLTDEEVTRYAQYGYVKHEDYPDDPDSIVAGRFWTAAELFQHSRGCGVVTTMGQALAETYARDPSFYGATFCCGCGKHLPVGAMGEFVWVDPETGRDTDERVGT
jgi:hypothetical protein